MLGKSYVKFVADVFEGTGLALLILVLQLGFGHKCFEKHTQGAVLHGADFLRLAKPE